MTKTLLLCDCIGTQSVDADKIADATGLGCSKVYSCLCTDQIEVAAAALNKGEVIVACQQERATFEALSEEIGAPLPAFVDIRDRAGWTDDTHPTSPKMAALVAEAALPAPAEKALDVVSEGTCLILGRGPEAVQAAQDLCDALAVTLLMPPGSETTLDSRFDMVVGTLKRASGTLGNFTVHLDALQQIIPGGRGAPGLTPPRDGARSACDIILDLSGNDPLFPAPEKRDGYLRADPGSLPAVGSAKMQAIQMVGTFEKPLYLNFEETLCAHSRAEKPACSKCLNVCPTGAITSSGDHVAIDPMVCAGCGACSALCPSGAIAYDAPPADLTFRRLSTLAATYRKAGGAQPVLLVHDPEHGAEMIALAARYGDGLPAHVIPFSAAALSGFGHAEILAALACGFAQVDILPGPKADRPVIEGEVALANAIAGPKAAAILDATEPDALCAMTRGDLRGKSLADPVLPMGNRRQVTRLAAKALHPNADHIALPEQAPYGAVVVDTDACTLCLSCVSLCPSGALGDNPDMPQLRFQEDACLQCGLCSNICPEEAITLAPRLNLTDTALTQVVVHEEEPFACVECGALFGVKSTVERITEKLAGNHAMFATSEAARMIQMCDNCRIQAQYHSQDNPFAAGERPRVRTTDDYLSKRKDH